MFSSWPAPESMIFEVRFRTRSDHGCASGRVPDPPHNADKAKGGPGAQAATLNMIRPAPHPPQHDRPERRARAREQQQGAYAVGFSLGGGLALCQHANRTLNLPVWSHAAVTRMQAGTPVARVPARAHPSCLGGYVLPQGACVC